MHDTNGSISHSWHNHLGPSVDKIACLSRIAQTLDHDAAHAGSILIMHDMLAEYAGELRQHLDAMIHPNGEASHERVGAAE